jgi:iron complex transport system substrate-binding protein
MHSRLSALLAVSCLLWSSAAEAVSVTDDRGQAVLVVQSPQRIVSLLPSLTETVCALGACQRLVGVDRYSNWPDSVKRLPSVGGGLDPSMERIVSLKPDLVLAAGSTRGAERLEALGLKVLRLEPRNHADAQRVFAAVGQALHLPPAQTDRAWQRIQADVTSAVQNLNPSARSWRVYVEVSPTPYGASESSFIGETLQRMGVGNILPAALGPFPQINPEFVVQAQPDVILAGDSSRAQILQRPGWSRLKAITQQRLCVFKPDESDVLVRAGPRMAEGARLMVDCLNRAAQTAQVRP